MSDLEPDRLTISTPEGVDLELTIAGIGSRFLALLVDQLIQLAVLLSIVAIIAFVGTAFSIALGTTLYFLVQFGYFLLFETIDSGRSPGKRVAGLRVVSLDGSPITFTGAVVRTVLRIVDSLPSFYLVAIIAAMSSARGQRLGDMAAGTLVIRERTPQQAPTPTRRPTDPAVLARYRAWDVSAVTAADTATVRSFLERRSSLTPAARAGLAAQLHTALAPKVGGADPVEAEPFLEILVMLKDER